MICQYELTTGGWVRFDMDKDVESMQPRGENTFIVLKNGNVYLLKGRNYGV
jgi:hypothetical protein